MESKSLHTIQVLCKIGKVLSTIVFICCIIGFVGCIIGLACLPIIPENGFKLNGLTIHNIIEASSSMSIPAIAISVAIGMVLCAAEAVVARFAKSYFKHELAAGTPFTPEGSRELMRLGILSVAIPLGTAIICGIAIGVAEAVGVVGLHFSSDFSGSIACGIFFMVLAVVCKYGTEVSSTVVVHDQPEE